MSGVGGGDRGARVSIPSSDRKLIQNIKEVAGNHTDEEIYAMLRECSMDPDETVQKLLFQDTFHEVKRKRDRRKENVSNKDTPDSNWRPGGQGRGGRGSRGNYSSRFISNETAGAKSLPVVKESGANQGPDKGSKGTFESSSVSKVANGPMKVVGTEGSDSAEASKAGSAPSPNVSLESEHAVPIGVADGEPILSLHESSSSVAPAPAPAPAPAFTFGVDVSASDSVLVSGQGSHFPYAVGTLKREVGNQQTVVEPIISQVSSNEAAGSGHFSSLNEKTIPDAVSSQIHGEFQSKSQGHDAVHLSEAPEVGTSANTGPSDSRPSSNYSNRPQPIIGPQKVGPSKEWKPKQIKPNVVHSFETSGPSDATPPVTEEVIQTQSANGILDIVDTTSELQKKFEGLQFSEGQHVIFPNHIRVPEAERAGLSFGSFNATFGSFNANESPSDRGSTLSESSHSFEENVEETSSCFPNASSAVEEEDSSENPQSPRQTPEVMSSGEADISSSISAGQESDRSKPETVITPGAQFSVVQTAPTYSTFGLMAPALGSQFAAFESSESQARDTSRFPSFVVQQPFDPSASYYTHMYRAAADGDVRLSPFVMPGAATKYNGYNAVSSTQAGQTQESGNSPVQTASGPAAVGPQSTGVMQSSIAVTQQTVPVFRQPAGVHISHYPPNFIPYSQYFSPFYVPPPAIHPFLSNTTFPQQHPAGAIYPSVAAATNPIKYSFSQIKPGSNSGNSAVAGSSIGYGFYSSNPTAYNSTPTTNAVNPTGNDDINTSQYKENNVYLTGQQSEGSTVWIPAPGREVPGLQDGSFYNLSPQGQHVAFTPAQAGHGAIPGIYHPTQTVAAAAVHPLLQQSQAVAGAAEMVGPPGGVYQQQQRAQMNWANNY